MHGIRPKTGQVFSSLVLFCDAGEVLAAGDKGIHDAAVKLLNWDKLQEHETPAYGAGATS